MKCESAHKIAQVWREFDKNIDIQYRIDNEHQCVFLRLLYEGNSFIYVCKAKLACLVFNGKTVHKGSIYDTLKKTEFRFSEEIGDRYYDAICAVLSRYSEFTVKPRSRKPPESEPVPMDKRPICMNCAYFSHCATSSSKRVGCESFVLK